MAGYHFHARENIIGGCGNPFSQLPFGWSFFLVDDIGLEPMTFRTSSGCSSQLS